MQASATGYRLLGWRLDWTGRRDIAAERHGVLRWRQWGHRSFGAPEESAPKWVGVLEEGADGWLC